MEATLPDRVPALFFEVFRGFVVAVSLLLVGACAGHNGRTTEVYLEDSEIHYVGKLSKTLNERAFYIYANAAVKPTTLTITSSGGSVSLGMDLGEWVHKHGLAVRVRRFCESSCANYVATAAKRLLLGRHSVISWHGSPFYDELLEGTSSEEIRWALVKQSLVEDGIPVGEAKSHWSQVRKRSLQFFEAVNVNPYITVGFLLIEDNVLANSVARLLEAGGGIYYPLDVMNAFGIKQIEVMGGRRWEPRLPSNVESNIVEIVPDSSAIAHSWERFNEIIDNQ